jgi:hypothetical protein
VNEYRGVRLEGDAPMGDEYCDALDCVNFASEYDRIEFPLHGTSRFRLCPFHAEVADRVNPVVADIERRFASHVISEEQGQRAETIRNECARLAERIAKTVPAGREQSVALTSLENVMFNAVAGICREGK